MTRPGPGKETTRSGLPGDAGAVRRLMNQSTRKQREKETKGRGRAAHGGKLGQDRTGRAKMTIETPLEIQAQVREMSEAADTFPADVVNLAIARLYHDWKAGEIDFYDYQIPSNHPRARWRLALEPVEPGD